MCEPTQKNSTNINSTSKPFLVEPAADGSKMSDMLTYSETEKLVEFGGDGSSPKSDKSILNDSDTNPASNTNIIEEDDLDDDDNGDSETDVPTKKGTKNPYSDKTSASNNFSTNAVKPNK